MVMVPMKLSFIIVKFMASWMGQPAAAFVLFQAYHLRSDASCCDCSLVNLEQCPIFGYQVKAECLDNEHNKNPYDGQL